MPRSGSHSLQGLIELSRRDGVEIRPTLLRVLADLYVQQPGHTANEAARFSELACRLLASADRATRMAVAERLASYPHTPPQVALTLARDEMAVAEPILRQSKALGAPELHAVLDSKSVTHAIAIAARPDLPASVAARIAGRADAAPESAAARPDQPIAERFLDADAAERLRILSALERLGPPDSDTWRKAARSSILERLEAAAFRHQPREFARTLEQALGLAPRAADRVAFDSSGEPLLVMLRALGAPAETVSRSLLLLNPEIGRSSRRVYALTELYSTISEAVAQFLAQGWREQPQRQARHQPQVALDASDRRDARAVHRETRAATSLPPARRARGKER
jgi:uncharacterized protein (DUF2336 family)